MLVSVIEKESLWKPCDLRQLYLSESEIHYAAPEFVDKDFLCLKFSIANGIFRVNGKDWFLDFQIHHLRRPQSLLR